MARININSEDMIKKYQEGKTIKELEKIYNCSEKLIRSRLREYGVVLNKRIAWNRKELPINEIIQDYQNGKNLKQIALKFNCSSIPVARILKANFIILRKGSKGRKPWNRKNLPMDEIVQKYQSGKTFNELGIEYGCNPGVIKKRLQEKNIKLRNSSESYLISLKEGKIKIWNKNKHLTKEHVDKLKEQYRINPNMGRRGKRNPHKEETKRKISITLTGRHLGANNTFWRGGTSTKNEKIRGSRKIKSWRKEVFKKNNYTCQKCLNKGGNLNAHHLYNFADFPEDRFNDLNGITLCKTCHQIFHKVYGKKNTAAYQVEEFLKSA